MFRFNNDYNEICHPNVLHRMTQDASLQMPGYGVDCACDEAAQLICKACDAPDAAVHFMVGGTQANLTVIAAALRPHQAVIGAESAHINVHETGAIEATGHKVLTLPTNDGKITAQQVKAAVLEQRLSGDAEHIAQPKLVYISQPTEFGTLYSLSELSQLSELCRDLGLYLYIDGARLGYGLTALENDVSLKDIAKLSDAFYIGGTKCGAMFGEAVVISNPTIAEDFRYIMKQRGGMLAKGWLLGQQFRALFENDLYFDICKHANQQAAYIRSTLLQLGYKLYVDGNTNQVFAVLPDALLNQLAHNFSFAVWEQADDSNTVVRFCTSWATEPSAVCALCEELKRLSEH